MIDLSNVKAGGRAAGWQPRDRDPEAQLRIEKERARLLARRVELLRLKLQ